MKAPNSKILYLGSDVDFILEMKRFFTNKITNIQCEDGLYLKGRLLRGLIASPIDIVFVDFSETSLESEIIIQEIIFLKKIKQFKSLLFVGLFKDEDQKRDYSHIFTSGFQLSYIKGCETETLFKDCFYIAFNKNPDFPVLALAKDINKDITVGICSTLTVMTADEFWVETDLDGIEGHLDLILPMFPDLEKTQFEIKENSKSPDFFPMTSCYALSYPFPGPWDDNADELLSPDTVETWLENNADDFEAYSKVKVNILTADISIMKDIFLNCRAYVDLNCDDETSSLDDEISLRKPSLIFINIDDELNGNITSSSLNFIFTNSAIAEGYRPIIIVTNCNSTGDALQKAFNYPLIIAHQGALTPNLFSDLSQKFHLKKQASEIPPLQVFKNSSVARSIDVLKSFTITSLTEHEVTFVSEVELPMFSVFHFTLPTEFYATLVPTFYPLGKKIDKHHYMAFVHGLSEEQLKELRKFVNQIIYSPLESFTPEGINKKMREASTNVEPLPVVPTEPTKNIEPNTNQLIEYKKNSFPGKSKL